MQRTTYYLQTPSPGKKPEKRTIGVSLRQRGPVISRTMTYLRVFILGLLLVGLHGCSTSEQPATAPKKSAPATEASATKAPAPAPPAAAAQTSSITQEARQKAETPSRVERPPTLKQGSATTVDNRPPMPPATPNPVSRQTVPSAAVKPTKSRVATPANPTQLRAAVAPKPTISKRVQPTAPPEVDAAPPTLRLVHSCNLQGELEPCG